jgi:hypothetical protein
MPYKQVREKRIYYSADDKRYIIAEIEESVIWYEGYTNRGKEALREIAWNVVFGNWWRRDLDAHLDPRFGRRLVFRSDFEKMIKEQGWIEDTNAAKVTVKTAWFRIDHGKLVGIIAVVFVALVIAAMIMLSLRQ